MKIKVQQFDQLTRNTLALAIENYCVNFKEINPEFFTKYADIAQEIRHGELLLCKYQYNDHHEKGGEEWN